MWLFRLTGCLPLSGKKSLRDSNIKGSHHHHRPIVTRCNNVSHIRQCQPFIGRCKSTRIFGRMQSIQDVVVAGLARIYLDVFAPMLFQLFNKCSPHHNMTFFRQTHGFGYRHKPTMSITNNIHNSLNVWSHEFRHVIHRTRWIIIS